MQNLRSESGRHVYRARGFAVILGLGALCALGGAGALQFTLFTRVGFFLTGLGCVAYGLILRLVLTEDAVEIIRVFGRQRVRRDEIVGRRTCEAKGQFGLPVVYDELVARGARKPFRIQRGSWATDAAFDEWLATIPDLDAEGRRPLSGKPAEEQQRNLNKRRWTILIVLVALEATVILSPSTSDATIAFLNVAGLAVPVLGLVYAATVPGSLPRQTALGLLMFFAGLAGMQLYRSSEIYERVQWTGWFIASSLVVGGVLFALAVAVPVLRRASVLIYLAPLAILYGFLTVATVNGSCDFAMPRQERVTVTGKEAGHGYWGSPVYAIRVGAWGPRPAGEAHSVPAAAWRRLRVGDTICVLHHPGALGIEWFAFADCRPQ